jgi:hypothetical protein
MKKMVAGDTDCRKIWARVIKKRFESGYPYIFFTDNVNNNAPQVYKDKKMKIHASNLCSEICLSSSPDETFVCNLSSMNLLHYEQWKNSDAVETLTYFLDAVMEDYIKATENIQFMRSAHNFAKNQRALGIGSLMDPTDVFIYSSGKTGATHTLDWFDYFNSSATSTGVNKDLIQNIKILPNSKWDTETLSVVFLNKFIKNILKTNKFLPKILKIIKNNSKHSTKNQNQNSKKFQKTNVF